MTGWNGKEDGMDKDEEVDEGKGGRMIMMIKKGSGKKKERVLGFG